MTPGAATPTGVMAMGMKTPHITQVPMTPEQMQAWRWEREIDERNKPITDEELEVLFPPGYKILPPPVGYVPIRTPSRKLLATPTPMSGAGGMGGFMMQPTPERGGGAGDKNIMLNTQPKDPELPPLKPEDIQYFDKLLADVDETTLTPEQLKEREIMTYLLKIKNGTATMRRVSSAHLSMCVHNKFVSSRACA
jgi:splicing factor 3B subunit 1